MGILNDMIMSSRTSSGIGQFKFDDSDSGAKNLIQQINRNQRQRWKKKSTIPRQVLQLFWEWGITIGHEYPKNGMGLNKFLESLEELWGPTPITLIEQNAFWLYENTVKSEFMSIGKGKISSKRPLTKLPL